MFIGVRRSLETSMHGGNPMEHTVVRKKSIQVPKFEE